MKNNNNMQNTPLMSPKLGYILDLLITSVLAILLLVSYARGGEFSYAKFIEETKIVYGESMVEKCKTLNARNLLNEVFEYHGFEIKAALDTICDNAVGSMLIKLFYLNRTADFRTLIIWNNDRAHTYKVDRDFSRRICIKNDDESEPEIKDNVFSKADFAIYLTPSLISDIRLSRFDGEKLTNERIETLDTVLFHELCHAFHYLISRNRNDNTETLQHFYGDSFLKQIWVKDNKLKDEEFCNITGFRFGIEMPKLYYDPLNCNLYEICKQLKNKNSNERFCQRIAHKDWSSLEKFCAENGIKADDCLYRVREFTLNLDEWTIDRQG